MPRKATLVTLLALLLAACGGPATHESAGTVETRHAIVLESLGQIGRPYRYGGSNPSGFDCSGLVQYVYLQTGIKLPRTTREQHDAGRKIELAEALPGDLLFYRFSGGRKADHVAIYLGDGEALHAPASGRSVIVARVDEPYWKARFIDAVRVLR